MISVKDYEESFKFWIIRLNYYQVSWIVLLLSINLDIIQIFLIFQCLSNILQIIYQLITKKNFKHIELIYQLSQNIIYIIFNLIAILAIQEKFSMLYLIIPLFINQILESLIENDKNIQYFNKIYQIFQFLVFFQTFFIIVRIENVIEGKWTVIFGFTWMILFGYFFLILAHIFEILRILYKWVLKKDLLQNILITIWLTVLNIQLFYMIIQGLSEFLTFQNDVKNSGFRRQILIMFIIQQLVLFFNLIFYKKIEILSYKFFSEDNIQFQQQVSTQNLPTIDQQSQLEDRITKVKEEDGFIPNKKIPRYIVKVNSTFFKTQDYDEIPQLLKPKKEQKVLNDSKPIMKTHSRQQSLVNKLNISNDISIVDNNQNSPNSQQNQNQDRQILQGSQSKSHSKQVSLFDVNSILNVSIDNKCVVCFDNQPDCIFLSCGHAGVCYQCGLDLWEQQNCCYLCRNKIEFFLQIDTKTQYKDSFFKVISATHMVDQ